MNHRAGLNNVPNYAVVAGVLALAISTNDFAGNVNNTDYRNLRYASKASQTIYAIHCFLEIEHVE